MALAVNSKLGHYEILSVLGVGGMGEVYRAHDSRLGRDVAIKVLQEEGAASADQRSRFEREARAVAALNHPNIVAVYDVGVEAGRQYIVSELIEGEPLRSRLTGKPVAPRKMLDIAAQVADGLAAAHSAGIVHRDLKPENIMLAREGRVKILDFGLARHTPAPGALGSGLDAASATEATRHLTHPGAVMGTANYMSPEQAAGKAVDYRTDQFSFGLILYEMASGKRAFACASAVETMAAIVREDPPPIEEKLPAPLKWIIDRCLAKEPEQRYESTRDLARDLCSLRDHFSEAYTSGSLAPIAEQKKRRRWNLPAAIAASCLITALLAALLLPVGQDISKYRYTPFASNAFAPVWSPDGKAVAYTGDVDGVYQVFLRYLNSSVPVQLTHEKHSVFPLGWSSDRNHLIVGEYADRPESSRLRLASMATVGGDPDPIMEVDCDHGCDLSRDGKAFVTLAHDKDHGDLYNVEISDPLGSPLRPYTPAPFATRGAANAPLLTYSPDGKTILLVLAGESLKEDEWLLPYPPGSGPPRRIFQRFVASEIPSFSWMPDSRHLVVSLALEESAPKHLWMADIESSRLTPMTSGNTGEESPSVSPDGKSVLYEQSTSNFDVVSLSLQDGVAQTLFSTGREESMPAWSAKADELAWVTNRSGPYEIWLRGTDRSVRPVVTAADFPEGRTKWFMNPALSPDGGRLIFGRIAQDGVPRLWIQSLAGGAPVRLTNSEADGEYSSVWSPDGTRFAYLQFFSGKLSLMVVRTTGSAPPVELKKDVMRFLPDWSPSGEWITYRVEKGLNLISPDGKTTKFLGKIETDYLAFSKDGKLLYGIQTETEADQNRATLFSLDRVTLKQKPIRELGKDLLPDSNFRESIRFSLAPDGKSFVYSTSKYRSELWMLQGYRQPGWLGRFSGILN
ncbi:MAG: protein kinase [Acidobacteriaceae bacterium]